MKSWKPLLLMLLILGTAGTWGCSKVEKRIDPEVDIGEAQVLVVPFQQKTRSPSVLRWHYESELGNTMARAIRMQLPASCEDVQLVSDERVRDLVFHTDTDAVPWSEVGRKVAASHILTGRVELLSFRDRRSVGMLQGRMQGYWELIRVSDNRSICRREFDIRVPENPETGRIYVSFETSENEVQGALVARLARQVSAVLCGDTVNRID